MTDYSIPQDSTPIDTSKDKRYWLFMWHPYEADGGMFDFVASYDTAEDAIQYPNEYNWERGMVFDSETRQNAMVLYARGWVKFE